MAMDQKRFFHTTEKEHSMNKERFISIVIPNYNGANTIAKCLGAAFSSDYNLFEVVVADDCSIDASVEIIQKFPCKLIRLKRHVGVSKARNKAASASSGELLFFIDSDCLLQKDALAIANQTFNEHHGHIVGGTYTCQPYDRNFFSTFQSIFINYFETKKKEPDYIAAHAMIINAELFRKSNGFARNRFIGIDASLEDVEFAHRLRRHGHKLLMKPEIQVQHIFNFSFFKSLKNALKRSRYWTIYSLANKDLLMDSGTASLELKINVTVYFINIMLFLLYWITGMTAVLAIILFLFLFDLSVNKKLFAAFLRARDFCFLVMAMGYYMMVYPIAVGAGAYVGAIQYIRRFRLLEKQ